MYVLTVEIRIALPSSRSFSSSDVRAGPGSKARAWAGLSRARACSSSKPGPGPSIGPGLCRLGPKPGLHYGSSNCEYSARDTNNDVVYLHVYHAYCDWNVTRGTAEESQKATVGW